MWNGDRTAKIRAGGIERLPVPGVDPASSPLQTIQFNQSWVAYVLGILPAMLHPAYWATSDPDVLANVQCQVQELLNLIAVGATILPPICEEEEDAMPDYVPIVGLPGTDESSRIVGTVAGGPPTSGNFLLNDIVLDRDGGWWRCIAGGSPGIWRGYGVGMPGLAANPRVPWQAGSTSDWYASGGRTPAAWTLDAGISVTYSPSGYAQIPLVTNQAKTVSHAPLTGATRFDIVARMRMSSQGGSPNIAVGFGSLADGSDMEGLSVRPQDDYYLIAAGAQSTELLTVDAYTAPALWQYWWITHAAGTLTLRRSFDGQVYDTIYSAASALTPTLVLLSTNLSAGGVVTALTLWLDFIALGNTTPAGQ